MDPPPPAPWTYAARAAYFGDRVCAFCQHHNPAGAQFCNDCASPLHLKPCNQCDAVNHRAATNCYKCGAEYPALFTTPGAPVLRAADTTPAWATPADVGVAATGTQPPFVGLALRPGWRLLSPDQLLLAAIATILIAGAYAAYRINAANVDAMGIASQAIGPGEHDALTATPAVPLEVESKPLERETTTELQPPIPTTTPEAPKRASAGQRPVPAPPTKHASAPQRPVPAPPTRHASAPQRPVPAPATKRAGASQRPVPELQASVGAIPPGAAHRPAPAPLGAPAANLAKAWLPETGQAMHASLARCSGDLFARILCEQRVRRRFCEGHWDETPECANGVTNDHGQ